MTKPSLNMATLSAAGDSTTCIIAEGKDWSEKIQGSAE